MIVEVMNRLNAEEYAAHCHKEQVVIISISSILISSACIIPNKLNGIVDVLKVKFNDTDSKELTDFGINETEAKKICDFVNKYKNIPIIDKIIVHCEAGQSRSAGVAAAIMKYLNNDDTPIFNNNRYHPNMLCYRTVLNHFMM